MSVDLVFGRSPITSSPANLFFGEDEFEALVREFTFEGYLPGLSFVAEATAAIDLTFEGYLPEMSFAADMQYRSDTSRPLVGSTSSAWQEAADAQYGAEHRARSSLRLPSARNTRWEAAPPVRQVYDFSLAELTRAPRSIQSSYGEGIDLRQIAGTSWQERKLMRELRTTSHREGIDLRQIASTSWQERVHRRDVLESLWESARRVVSGIDSLGHRALHTELSLIELWEEAIRPPPGLSIIVTVEPPAPDPCYVPSPHLLFSELFSENTNLVFICERHGPPPVGETIVVPVRRVYVVINNVSLRRVADNLALPALSMTMAIDADSWTWSFSASLPGSELPNVQDDQPVEVEVTVNGYAYRFLIEKIARERTFGRNTIKVAGRGKSAVLDAPYSPIFSYGNSEDRTAQQLMNEVLTLNGVSIGWDVDWQATDWLVPAGLWSHQGSYMSALQRIAEAAGSYIQPHPTAQTVRVLPKYPYAPWEWGTVTPDYELPSAVTTQEGIEWVDMPVYNRVFVSGVGAGVLGQITRAGTDGALVAPMITDPLMSVAAAARQRGIPVLADTGRRANVTLRLPVLSEIGPVTPGKFVRYVDGATTRLGIVRSTNVDFGRPEVWQTIGVETRA